MLRKLKKVIFVAGLVGFTSSAFSMNIYTVKSNDYLYKIAKNNPVSGVSISELTDAIKGINKSEIPGIVSNRIGVGDKLALPTNKDEVEDGLMLARGQSVTSKPSVETVAEVEEIPAIIDNGNDLGDRSMMVQQVSARNVEQPASIQPQQTSSISDVPDTIYPVSHENNSAVSYQQSFENQIHETKGQSEKIETEEGTISLLTLLLSLIVIAVVGFFGKKHWDRRSLRKEEEMEVISKKRRDHLMSRISPVVSDASYYRPKYETVEEVVEKDVEENIESFFEESTDKKLQDIEVSDVEYGEINKNVKVETDRGVVFETVQDVQNTVEELDELEEDDFEEQDLEFVFELVEQYLESEKFEEARFTILDSVDKYPSNVELRYLLLQLYALSNDEIAFNGEVHAIKSKNIVSMFDPLHQKIAKLKDKYFEY